MGRYPPETRSLFWDLPISGESTLASVQRARTEYDGARAAQRHSL